MSADLAQADPLETETIHEIVVFSESKEKQGGEDENEMVAEVIVNDFPDGGWRAWSVVLGVSGHLSLLIAWYLSSSAGFHYGFRTDCFWFPDIFHWLFNVSL